MDRLPALVTIFAVFILALPLPGPDFVAVVRPSMTRETTAGLLTMICVALVQGFCATLSLAGLSAILFEYQWLTWTVCNLGGSYLVYLGVRLLFGFRVTVTNPKAIVLFASVLAIAASDATPAWLMRLIVAIVVVSGITWYSIVNLFMSSAPVIKGFENTPTLD